MSYESKNLFAENWLMRLSEAGFDAFKQAVIDVVVNRFRSQLNLNIFIHH